MRCVVWETWNSGKAAWRTEEFLFLPASCQPWENRACSFPPGLLQRNMYIVFIGGKKENIHFHLLLLARRRRRWLLFMRIILAAQGQCIMKAVDIYAYCSQLREIQGWLLQRSMPNLYVFFFKDHVHSILFTNIEWLCFSRKIVINIFISLSWVIIMLL